MGGKLLSKQEGNSGMNRIKKMTIEKQKIKWANMSFDDFYKEYIEELDKALLKEYNKASSFKKIITPKKSTIFESKNIKSIAKTFFELGRLQMVSEINLDLRNPDKVC